MNCPSCDHSLFKHRENTPTQRTAIGDPVECFAAVYVDTSAGPTFDHLCGCRWLIDNPQPKEMDGR